MIKPCSSKLFVFLSTPSVRRATRIWQTAGEIVVISIHALREEGDLPSFCDIHGCSAISIHALREEGDVIRLCRRILLLYFYPRPP